MMLFLLAMLLILFSLVIISYPLVAGALERFEDRESEDEEYSERDSLLEAMSDLEMSLDTGKISEEAYKAQKLLLQKDYLDLVEGEASK